MIDDPELLQNDTTFLQAATNETSELGDPQVSEPVAEPATLKALWCRSVAPARASLASASQHVSRDVSQPRLVYRT